MAPAAGLPPAHSGQTMALYLVTIVVDDVTAGTTIVVLMAK